MAARVDEDHRVGGKGRKSRAHAVKAKSTEGAVVVGVGGDFESGELEDRDVVAPGRVRHDDEFYAENVFRKERREVERSRTADRLHGGRALGERRGALGAEEKTTHALVVGGKARHRDVGVGFAARENASGGFLHGRKERHHARVGEVGAHREVHLFGTFVLLKEFVEPEDGIVGAGLKWRKKFVLHECRPRRAK